MMWQAVILSLFPEMFPGPLGLSLAGKALDRGDWSCESIQIRDFATDKHRTVDDTPFGGGAGMVMRPDVLDAALCAAQEKAPSAPLVYLSPRGKVFDQQMAQTWAEGPGVIMLCGRYEGVDQRVLEAHDIQEVSMGDMVLSGGESAALCMLDACVRLLPGVMGNEQTVNEESFANGLLEYPHYTRPSQWVDRAGVQRNVPDILLSGHHEKIDEWRHEQSIGLTKSRRPDLWCKYLDNKDKA